MQARHRADIMERHYGEGSRLYLSKFDLLRWILTEPLFARHGSGIEAQCEQNPSPAETVTPASEVQTSESVPPPRAA